MSVNNIFYILGIKTKFFKHLSVKKRSYNQQTLSKLKTPTQRLFQA